MFTPPLVQIDEAFRKYVKDAPRTGAPGCRPQQLHRGHVLYPLPVLADDNDRARRPAPRPRHL